MNKAMNPQEQRSALFDYCGGLVECESVLDEMEKEIRSQGYAGSADVPKLIFLTLYTGVLPTPVSLVIKGPSASGKSFSLNAAIQFFPPSAFERFEGMSEKAIVYLKDIDLRHKHLVIGEAAGMAQGEGRTLLRQLLSEGTVRYATVQNTPDGLKGVDLPLLHGPTGLIMTTTANSLHHEDETRMLSVGMNESPEHIRQALMAQAEGWSTKPQPIDTTRWHNFYEYVRLANTKVLTPFAMRIVDRLPTTHDRIRRDFPHVLSLIRAHALLHEMHRETWRASIVANERDYAAVRELVDDALSQGLAVAVPDAIRRVVEGVQALSEPEPSFQGGVSITKLAEHLERDPSAVSRTVTKALDQGFLQNSAPGQGREARLALGERSLPSGSVLPTVEEVFSKKSAPAKAG
jgi:hypothetical protein